MTTYHGTITASPQGETVRLDGALAEAHPEFQGELPVRAQVIAPGQLLISLQERPAGEAEEDPLEAAYLALLENDMRAHPERIRPLDEGLIESALRLVEGVTADDNDTIPDDVTL